MPVLLQIALGGALGSLLRFTLTGAAMRAFGAWLPWGAAAVNVLGSFLMGVVAVLALARPDAGLARAWPFPMPGLLGGFTTFSAFSLDAVQLVERDRVLAAAAYVAGSVALGLAALAAGLAAGRAWSAGP